MRYSGITRNILFTNRDDMGCDLESKKICMYMQFEEIELEQNPNLNKLHPFRNLFAQEPQYLWFLAISFRTAPARLSWAKFINQEVADDCLPVTPLVLLLAVA